VEDVDGVGPYWWLTSVRNLVCTLIGATRLERERQIDRSESVTATIRNGIVEAGRQALTRRMHWGRLARTHSHQRRPD